MKLFSFRHSLEVLVSICLVSSLSQCYMLTMSGQHGVLVRVSRAICGQFLSGVFGHSRFIVGSIKFLLVLSELNFQNG